MVSSVPISDIVTAAPSSVTEHACTQRLAPPLISRLLPEILQIIFVYCARDYYTTYDGYPIESAPTWVNISYVCRHWRAVALACPALWSYLFTASPRWTKELLARSKQAPLKFHVFTNSLCEQVTDHLERIQELHLHLNDRDIEKVFCSWLSSARAPRLQNLKIFVYWDPPTERFPILFHGDTPALRTLELSNCAVPWYSFRLTSLTTLGLYEVHLPFRKNMAEFLSMLRSMPHLETLYLHDALCSATASRVLPSAKSHAKVDLPHLSCVSIVAPCSIVTDFLTCVNVPSKTKILLDWHYEDGFVLDDYALLFSILGKQLGTYTDQGLPAPIFRSLVIEYSGHVHRPEGLTFSPLELDLNPLEHGEWGYHNPSYSFDGLGGDCYLSGSSLKIRVQLDSLATVDRVLTDISSFVPLSNIWSVGVLDPPFHADFWRMTLGHLQRVRYIKLSNGDLPDIASVLSLSDLADDDDARQDGRVDQVVLAPALEELELQSIRLLMRPSKRLGGEIGDVQSLSDALATRKGAAGRFLLTRCWGVGTMAGEWGGGCFRAIKHHRTRGLRL